MLKMENSNGCTYEILALCPFKEIDEEYYKDSWQNYAVGLLKSESSYVVVSMLGENSWGNGAYYSLGDKERAYEQYRSACEKYNKD